MALTKTGNIDFVDDFFVGYQACEKGEECPEGASEAFVRGYGSCYEREQIADHATGVSHG